MRQSGPDFEHYASWSLRGKEDDVKFDQAGLSPRDDKLPWLGKSFGDFAQWVFGPTGILSLRLLAFGDFSYRGRFVKHNLLLCRRERPTQAATHETQNLYFRSVTVDDQELWELVEKHFDVLEACPADSLFKV